MIIAIPKHGEVLTLDLTDNHNQELMQHIVDTHFEASTFLLILTAYGKRKFDIPCKQCLLDCALQFKDIGAALEELADGK